MDTHPVLAYYIDSTLNLTHPLVVNGTAKYARIHMKNYKKILANHELSSETAIANTTFKISSNLHS